MYDLCCDHGEIGMQAQALNKNLEVIYNDIVPEILEKLLNRLSSADITSRFVIFKEDARICKFPKIEKYTHFNISGIGSDVAMAIIENILKQITHENEISITLSAHTKILSLRRYLNSTNLSLVKETLIHENNQFYEILELSSKKGDRVSLYGNAIWEESNEAHRIYLERLITEVKLKLRHTKNKELQLLMKEYDKLLNKLT